MARKPQAHPGSEIPPTNTGRYRRWRCSICSYIYSEETGESETNTPAGTRFADLPDTWQCPICKAGKQAFVSVPDEKETEGTTVADVLVKQLTSFGITEFFGVPGTSSLGIIDAIRKNKDARFILFRHEEQAALAASAYHKFTGKMAACVTIAGPGATNLATGLYDAKEDRTPVLSLNGQVAMQYTGPGGFQEIDQDAFFRPITVYNNTIYDRKMATRILTTALQHAVIRSGVAQISVPNDIQKQPLEGVDCTYHGCIPSMKITPDTDTLDRAAAMLDLAENPVILAGWGAYPYSDLVHSFSKAIDAPVLSTFRAKGILPDGHPQYAGILGTVGSMQAREMVEQADLLVTLGVGFSKMTRIPENLRILQVDRDPLKLGRGTRALSVYGDVGEVLTRLIPTVRQRGRSTASKRVKAVIEPWDAQREQEADPKAKPIRPPYIMKVLSDVIPDEALISVDVGENGWWFGRNFKMKKQRFAMSGYLATMGFGLPGAIAAKLAYPDSPVFCITGDGGFAMAMADFVTAVKYDLPMVVIILNNQELGMIRVEQKIEYYENFATDLKNPDFAMYAKSCGGEGKRVTEPEDLGRAVRWGMQQEKPVIIDIDTDPDRF
ncbi:MAG: thiamine pyrophosphate-dependent enzyme [Methanospirillum sp.]|uniref:thiamine pyrophosphate-dependent enzyme n=1 Tax=Methanospirillum sp. TaxID=45200 RepID=UPI0023716C77|nr:thiamine pyrophosphate-dependent enzyme [Methanospirillum sp.]MDD1730024.1 thiamine pyrophosphate-dependent enzyme [Methanospirillum sp.]